MSNIGKYWLEQQLEEKLKAFNSFHNHINNNK